MSTMNSSVSAAKNAMPDTPLIPVQAKNPTNKELKRNPYHQAHLDTFMLPFRHDVTCSKTTVYLAGPMRGYPFYNFPIFDYVRDALIVRKYIVFSPADYDRDKGFDPASLPKDHNWHEIPEGFDMLEAARTDLNAIFECDAIVMLHGWEESTGATAEHAVAKWIGKTIFYETANYKFQSKPPINKLNIPSEPKASNKETVLEEASRLVNGPRREEYGHPSVNFTRVAKSWSAILDKEITPTQVSQCMIGLKLMRANQSPSHRDTWVDIAGYAQTAAILEHIDE